MTVHYNWSALAFYRGGVLLTGDEKRAAAKAWAMASDPTIFVYPQIRPEHVDFGDLLKTTNPRKGLV